MKKEMMFVALLVLSIFSIPLAYAAVKQCSDGIDNDANGCFDYGNDSGCSAPTDDDESGGSCTCSSLGGSCCVSGQTCLGGAYQNSSDCSSLCCVGGSCTDMHYSCSGRTCELVAGAGADECSVNSDCYSCGDGTCDADESCSNCSADCLIAGQICCSGTAYIGNCCNNSNCSASQICTSHICVSSGYCGDGTCDANESCSNCSADCALSTGQCCAVTSSNADSHGRVNSTYVTTSGKICCSGTDYTGTCCTDAECASPNVCASNHTCITPYTIQCTSSSCTCDLSLTIQANSIFQTSLTNFYIYLKDLRGNYTGSVTVTHWVENSSGYVSSHSPANMTMSINENKTMTYNPVQRCGNSTEYLKASISNPGCNDTSSSNNQPSATITIHGSSCSATSSTASTETTEEAEEETEEEAEEVIYTINVPSQIQITEEEESSGSIQKTINVSVNLENKENKTKEFEIWSYVFSGDSCYSCADGEKDANKIIISIDSGMSDTIDLENILNLSLPGTYTVRVQVLDKETSEIKDFDYNVQVASSFESETELSANKLEQSSAQKAKLYSLLLFSLLLAGTAGFFGYRNREKIMGFIDERKKAFQKKQNWKEYLEERRGKGIFERLSGGFMKSKEK